MSTAELKVKIISGITESQDENLLMVVMRLIELDSNTEDIYMLNEEELRIVSEGEADIKDGNLISNQEANKEIQKWLGK